MTQSSIAMLVSILIITFLVPLLVSKTTKKNTMENIVKASAITYITGIITLIFATVAIIMSIRQQVGTWVVLVFFSLFILGLYLSLYGFFWRITYGSSGFTYRTCYGKETTVSYESITKIKVSKSVVHIYGNKKHFYVDNMSVGSPAFLRKLPKQLLKEGTKKAGTTVKPPLIGHIVGGFGVIAIIVIVVMTIFQETKWISLGLSPSISLMDIFTMIMVPALIYMFLHDCFWSLTFDSSGFTYRTFYGKKTRVAYSSITRIRYDKTSCIIYANKKRFYADYYGTNFDDFHEKASKHLSKHQPQKKRYRKKRR